MLIFLRILLLFLLTSVSLAALRDPTRPENIQEGQITPGPTGELEAIILSKRHKVAIYNGQPLYLGSKVAGFSVVAIKPNTVHLQGPDGKMVLFLFNQTIKKASQKPI